jgi:predicted transposase YdaD
MRCIVKKNFEVAEAKKAIFIIELPKVDLKKASINDMFSVWMYFLKNPELVPSEFLSKVPEVNEALNELKVMSADEDFKIQYDAYLGAENDRISRETNAEARGKAQGLAAGLAEGEAKRLVKGKKEGIAIGEAKGLALVKDTARSLLAEGMSPEVVSRCTKLSMAEVTSLRE